MRKKLGLALVSVAIGLAPGCSCGSDDDRAGSGGTAGVDGGTGGSGGLDLWTAWQQIQSALRQSPDHLPAQADAVVATKDPQKIFEFVRDQIATYPPRTDGFAQATSITRWGVKATLRGGAGTPRERADLLVSLYQQAGLEAEVVQGDPDPAKLDGQQVLLRSIDRVHAPAYTPDDATRWAAALGHDTLTQFTRIDADGTKTKALADQLIAAMPSDLTSPFDFTLPAIPLVRVKVGGNWTYANPLGPNAQFGDALTTGTPTATGSASAAHSIHVKLEAARADDPYTRFTLVEGSYDAEDVVGRRIQLAFPPPVAPDQLAKMRPADIETMVPVLSVVGLNMTDTEKESLAHVGDMLSLGGSVYKQEPGGGISVDGEALAPVDSDPTSLAKVETVTVRANGHGYSRIRVTVGARDATGKNVPRLGADAFDVREDDQPVSFALSRNEAPPPRVILLYDVSTSVPAQFLGTGAVDLGNQIVQPLYAKYPQAQFRAAYMNFGASFVSGTWASSLSEAQTQVQALASATGGSELWEALHDVAKESPTVVLMVTDGDETDVKKPQFVQSIAAGPPVLSIAVGTVKQVTLDEISDLSGGKSVPVSQLSQATTAALAEIDARAVEDYVLSYRAPESTATTRTVTVTINQKTGTDTYDVPTSPVIPKAFSGLYLTLSVPGREHTATIAGFDLGYSTAFPTITEAMLKDVRAALAGRISIKVEGAAPSASVVLDDWIAEKLALRPIVEAAQSKDEAQFLEALEAGFSATPGKLPLAQPPLPDATSTESLTFETGPRIAAMIQKFSEGGPISRELHLFPMTQWATAASDARLAWEKTLRATAALAVMEADFLEGPSTLENLKGVPIAAFTPASVDTQPGLTPEQQLKWGALAGEFSPEYTLLAPVAPGPFWAVHAGTGTVIGMLPSGTGGGAEDVCATYDAANSYLQIAGLLGNFFGVSVGGWVALAQWEVKYVTMATLVIGYGATAGSLTNPAIDMGCGAINDAIGNLPGGVGQVYTGGDSILGTYNDINPGEGDLPTLCGTVAGNYSPCP